MNSKNIRMKLKSFDHNLLDHATKKIVHATRKTGSQIKGPFPLPAKTSRITVLKSPHINKRAREQFEMKVYKRLIDICEPTSATIAALVRLEIAAGVHVDIKLDNGG